ncbi:hypothetical protein LOZ66_000574 [Ophidiomyces ophidiicola]|nr:hypothetical protein LOZ66_000574 [Ophidiomyces ophidiicola]
MSGWICVRSIVHSTNGWDELVVWSCGIRNISDNSSAEFPSTPVGWFYVVNPAKSKNLTIRQHGADYQLRLHANAGAIFRCGAKYALLIDPLTFHGMFTRPVPGPSLCLRRAPGAVRRLALAGSTVGAVGSVVTVGTITYEINRRIGSAECLLESKRSLSATCPNYNMQARRATLSRIVEAAESGEYLDTESIRPEYTREAANKEAPPRMDELDRNRETGTKRLSPRERNTLDDSLSWIQTLGSLKVERNVRTPPVGQPMIAEDNFTALLSELQSKEQAGNYLNTQVKRHNHDSSDTNRSNRRHTKRSGTEESIQRLVDASKFMTAAQRFLTYIQPSPDVSENAKDICFRLFNETINAGHFNLAYRLYEWMDFALTLSPESWEAMIHALGTQWKREEVVEVYLKHSETFEISKQLRPLVLTSLLHSLRLEDAKQFVFRFLKDDKLCSLCNVYILGLWKKTGDIELVKAQFDASSTMLRQNKIELSRPFFSGMLEALVEADDPKSIVHLIEDMKARYDHSPPGRLLSKMARQQALKFEWEEVFRILEKLHELHNGSRYMLQTFHRVFLEFSAVHSGPKIRDFFFRGIENFGIIPDNIFFNHIARTYLQKGTTEMIVELIKTAEDGNWPVTLDKEKLLKLAESQHRRISTPPSIWEMSRLFGRLHRGQRVPNVNIREKPNNLLRGKPYDFQSRPSTFDYAVPLEEHLIYHIEQGSPGVAVGRFQEIRLLGRKVSTLELNLAVTAMILRDRSILEAKHTLETDMDALVTLDNTALLPFFKRILSYSNDISEEEALALGISNFYDILVQEARPINNRVLVTTCASLIAENRPKDALRLMRFACNHDNAPRKLDAKTVRMVANASADIGHLGGIHWSIMAALRRDLPSTVPLVADIYTIIENLRSSLAAPNMEYTAADRKLVEYLVSLVRAFQPLQQHGDDLKKLCTPDGEPLSRRLESWSDIPQLAKALVNIDDDP